MNIEGELPEGVELSELRQITDDRGAVLHLWRSGTPGAMACGECYFSEIVPKAIKGWKRHHLQTQNLAVPVGRLRIVMYDDRAASRTVGRVTTIELGRPDAYQRLKIPPGIWYGFACLSTGPALLANCPNLPHDPKEGEQRSLNDPSIPYQWSPPALQARQL